MPIHLDENHMNDPLYRASVADGIIREDEAAERVGLTALEAEMLAALHIVGGSAGWQYMTFESRASVEAVISHAEARRS